MRPALTAGGLMLAVAVIAVVVGKMIDEHRGDPDGQAAEDDAQAAWLDGLAASSGDAGCLVLGVAAIAGLPPFGIFMSEFLLVTSTFARQPWLAVPLVGGILVAVGALFLRLGGIAFGGACSNEEGSMEIELATLSGNVASTPYTTLPGAASGAAYGGAIAVGLPAGGRGEQPAMLSLRLSTVSGNSAIAGSAQGGGVFAGALVPGPLPTVRIVASRFARNVPDGIAGNDDAPPKEPLQSDLRSVGFGRPTGIDLPGEYGGRVPDALWKRSIHEKYPKDFPFGDWVPGDFVNMSIGQGDTLVTPIQMAQAYAALLDGGRVCAARLLRAVQTADGVPVRTLGSHCGRKLPFAASDLAYVRDALAGTVRDGTAAAVFRGFPLNDVWVSGKTGTAQVFNRQDFSWFAAMTARGEQKYVVVAVVEQGGHGATTAAPIVRRVIEALYGLPLTPFATSGATD